MSYAPIRSRRTPSSTPPRPPHQVDYSAFDLDAGSDDDDDDDDPSRSTAPSLSRHTTASTQSPLRSSTQRTGGISLGDSFSDPLTSPSSESPDRPLNHHQPVPGAYDFEPQGNEGRPPAIQHRSRPLPVSASTPAPGVAGQRHRRPMSLSERFLPAAIYSRFTNGQTADQSEDSGLLFSHDGQESSEHDTDAERELLTRSSTDAASGGAATSYPPRGTPSHVPLPARPPQFAAPTATTGGRIFGGGQGNDGVFANLSAKPEGMRGGDDYVGGDDFGGDKDEVLPAYEVAAQDTTPPYWETTVITPQGLLGPGDICVDGLPVGNLFGFAWNLLVSMSFQFVGFLLTYLLHTTHAAKNGSRAGLGITLIQLGFYLKERIDHPELLDQIPIDTTLNSANPHEEVVGWTWWGGAVLEPTTAAATSLASATMSAIGSLPTQAHSALSNALDASDPDVIAQNITRVPSLGNLNGQDVIKMSSAANEWLAFFLVTVGSFLLIGGCLSYWRAVRWARAVRQGMGPNNDAEATFVVA